MAESRIRRTHQQEGYCFLKNKFRPPHSDYWCPPNKADAELEFVAYMEDVLDLYELPYHPDIPVVCMDEKPYPLLGEARESWTMRPGNNEKVNFEYIRNVTRSIVAFVEAFASRHYISVHGHCTAIDWAKETKYLVDVMYLNVQKIILVIDNLNMYELAPLYKAFAPEEARHIVKKLEIHYTPKHGC